MEEFKPTPWCFTGRCQTVLRPIFNEAIPLPDDGELLIDWLDDTDRQEGSDKRPIVVILPGLTGCSCANYIKHMVMGLAELNYRVVVFNNRGTCKHVLKTPRTYCAADTSDAAHVFSHIRERFPDSPMAAIGISLGGMILYNYLASLKTPTDCPLSAALVISVVWDPRVSAHHMENPVDWLLFNRLLTNHLIKLARKNAHILETKFDLDDVLKARTIRQFDANLTVQMFGFKDLEDYYDTVHLPRKLQDIPIPLLCLAAEDDPFVPKHTLPIMEVATTDNVALVLTKRGGHIGFLEGWFPRHTSYMDRVACEFAQAVFECKPVLEQLVVAKQKL